MAWKMACRAQLRCDARSAANGLLPSTSTRADLQLRARPAHRPKRMDRRRRLYGGPGRRLHGWLWRDALWRDRERPHLQQLRPELSVQSQHAAALRAARRFRLPTLKIARSVGGSRSHQPNIRDVRALVWRTADDARTPRTGWTRHRSEGRSSGSPRARRSEAPPGSQRPQRPDTRAGAAASGI